MKYLITPLLMSFIAINALAQTNVVYVDADATGSNDGTSWTDAFAELSDAANFLDTASSLGSSPEVWVAEGTYKPDPSGLSNSQEASFEFNNNVALYGGFDGSETSREQADPKNNLTVLSADLNGNDSGDHSGSNSNYYDNCYNVIKARPNMSLVTFTIDGFTIEGGRAVSGYGKGAAIYSNAVTNISRCVFRNNFGVSHHAIVYAGPAFGANVVVRECKFHDNHGGRTLVGIENSASNRTYTKLYIYNNEFYHNTADLGIIYGHQYYLGTSANNKDLEYYIYNNTFYKNELSDTTAGAPIYFHQRDNQGIYMFKVDVVGNIFWENDAANKAIFIENRSSVGGSYTKELERLYFFFNLIDGNDTLTKDNLYIDKTPWNGFAGYSYVQSNFYNQYPMFNDTASLDLAIIDCNAPGNDMVNYRESTLPTTYSSRDILGNDRNVGIRVDIGPYEVQNEFNGLTASQQGQTIVATPGYEPYTWYDNRNPQSPVLLTDTTNTITPANDGEYIVLAENADGCNAIVYVDFCAQVQVSVSIDGDSLRARGTGGNRFTFRFEGNSFKGNTTDSSAALNGYGKYSVSHFNFSGGQVQGCINTAEILYCGSIPNVSISQKDSILEASVGDAANYQWYLDGNAIPGATSATYSLTGAADGGYSVEVSENDCHGMSDTLNYCNAIPTQPEVTSENGELFVDNSFDTYQWFLNGVAISGATSATYMPVENGQYTVKVGKNGCERTSIAFEFTSTGVFEYSVGNIRIYPNPANNSVTFASLPNNSKIQITDIAGKLIAEINPTEDLVSLDVSGWQGGVYLVRMAHNQDIKISRLTINP